MRYRRSTTGKFFCWIGHVVTSPLFSWLRAELHRPPQFFLSPSFPCATTYLIARYSFWLPHIMDTIKWYVGYTFCLVVRPMTSAVFGIQYSQYSQYHFSISKAKLTSSICTENIEKDSSIPNTALLATCSLMLCSWVREISFIVCF